MKMSIALFFIASVTSLYCYSQSRNLIFFDLDAKYSDRVYQNKMKGTDSNIGDSFVANKNISKLIYDNFKENYEKVEKPAFGYGISGGVLCKYKNGFALKYGVGYSKINEKLELTRKVATYRISGLIVPIYKSNLIYYNNYQYSSLFIGLQFRIIEDDRFSFSITLEPQIALLLSSKIVHYYGTENAIDLKSYYAQISRVVINASLGGFFIYRLTNILFASIHPSFVRNINPSIQYQNSIGGVKSFHINQINYWYSINIGFLISLSEKNSDVLNSF